MRRWRKETRERLLRERVDAGVGRRADWSKPIDAELRRVVPSLGAKSVGFYWPFRGEFDARPLIRQLISAGGMTAALPAVVQPKSPLEFRRWVPGAAMEHGVYNIPVPKEREVLEPKVLIVPLVGFDAAGFRLGYGGGYYDRTIASFAARPYAIGVGFELSRLGTIHPQPHDIPMNAVLTEAGFMEHRPRG
ncbi:MAG: 5-formyltetrahydrofolate cyclo-ligase [Alphaproteobacteria bacterium]|nr:5-formyltetrahydrofolate cyclo-ligase [Alphaproteobacteria bacterium]